MKKVKIAVFVSGSGTNLQALIDAEKAGKLPSCELALVVSSNSHAKAIQRAEAAGIPARVNSKKRYPDVDVRTEKLNELLKEYEIDMIVLAGYLGIIRRETFDLYEGRIINIHPSLIPSFCGVGYYGKLVHEAVLARGVKVTGATVHRVTLGVDEGEILMQKAVDVMPGDTPDTLQLRVMEQAEWVILPAATEMIANQILKEL